MFNCSRFPVVCFVFLTFCCFARAFLFACFCRGEPYTAAECIEICNRRFGTVQDGEFTQFITRGMLNESKTKCFCRITIGFNAFLRRKDLDPHCYEALFCVSSWMANRWLKDHGIKVTYVGKKPKAEIEEVVPGVFMAQELEDANKPEDPQPPRLGPFSYITGVPSYIWSKLPGWESFRAKPPPTATTPVTVDVSVPTAEEFKEKQPFFQGIRDKVPSIQVVRESVPSLQDLRDKVPTFQDLRDKAPTFKGLRDRAPTFKDLREKAPTFRFPFRGKDKKSK